MHELAEVWTTRKGLALIAVNAILYALVLVPFNQAGLTIAGIPVRPAAALPVVFGILWGPAAAWGLSIGNVAGDLFGSWSPMSIFGFLANFLYPYLSYLLWHGVMKDRPARADPRSLAVYWAVAFIATLVSMAFLAACGTVFFGRPFGSRFTGYFGNNILWAMTAGVAIYWVSLEKAARRNLVYGRKWEGRI